MQRFAVGFRPGLGIGITGGVLIILYAAAKHIIPPVLDSAEGFAVVGASCAAVLLACATAGLMIERGLSRTGMDRAGHEILRGGRVAGAIVVAIGALPFAVFIGMVVGGTFGGGMFSLLGKWAIPLGIATGMFVVIVILELVSAVVGALLGAAFARIVLVVQK